MLWRLYGEEVADDAAVDDTYANRIAAVSGQDDLSDVSRHEAVQGFAPVSMEAPDGQPADRYDLLISTDVLAEGVNLQQCRHIINFDVPWNPMRLVQRHGRIDRIGSQRRFRGGCPRPSAARLR